MIKIPISNGVNLVAEQSTDECYKREIYIGLATDNGMWIQDLAIVRQAYNLPSDDDKGAKYIDGKYQVIVYADKETEDYTHKFDIEEVEIHEDLDR